MDSGLGLTYTSLPSGSNLNPQQYQLLQPIPGSSSNSGTQAFSVMEGYGTMSASNPTLVTLPQGLESMQGGFQNTIASVHSGYPALYNCPGGSLFIQAANLPEFHNQTSYQNNVGLIYPNNAVFGNYQNHPISSFLVHPDIATNNILGQNPGSHMTNFKSNNERCLSVNSENRDHGLPLHDKSKIINMAANSTDSGIALDTTGSATPMDLSQQFRTSFGTHVSNTQPITPFTQKILTSHINQGAPAHQLSIPISEERISGIKQNEPVMGSQQSSPKYQHVTPNIQRLGPVAKKDTIVPGIAALVYNQAVVNYQNKDGPKDVTTVDYDINAHSQADEGDQRPDYSLNTFAVENGFQGTQQITGKSPVHMNLGGATPMINTRYEQRPLAPVKHKESLGIKVSVRESDEHNQVGDDHRRELFQQEHQRIGIR